MVSYITGHEIAVVLSQDMITRKCSKASNLGDILCIIVEYSLDQGLINVIKRYDMSILKVESMCDLIIEDIYSDCPEYADAIVQQMQTEAGAISKSAGKV